MTLEGRVENGAIVLEPPTPLPEGARVRIEIISGTEPTLSCFGALLPKATFDPQALEAMRSHLTREQYEALSAIASQDLLDVDAIAELRAASMI